MRKIIWYVMSSLDGFAGPNGEFDWPLTDEEFEETTLDLLNAVDYLLGRVTYEMMANYWPTAVTNPTGVPSSGGKKFSVPTITSRTHTEIAQKIECSGK
jgi:dihydrofolate reductase